MKVSGFGSLPSRRGEAPGRCLGRAQKRSEIPTARGNEHRCSEGGDRDRGVAEEESYPETGDSCEHYRKPRVDLLGPSGKVQS